MLVLSRKIGERVLIGGDVVVTVVRIGPNAVRLGISAPDYMNIVREEIVDVLMSELDCGNCREPAHDCNCVVADA